MADNGENPNVGGIQNPAALWEVIVQIQASLRVLTTTVTELSNRVGNNTIGAPNDVHAVAAGGISNGTGGDNIAGVFNTNPGNIARGRIGVVLGNYRQDTPPDREIVIHREEPYLMTKAEIPILNGGLEIEALLDWVSEVDQYFELMSMEEDRKVIVIDYRLKGSAAAW